MDHVVDLKMKNGSHPPKDLFDLGLSIGTATLKQGQRRTYHEIACFPQAAGAHCSWQRVCQIEQKALRKIRAWLYRNKLTERELRLHL